MKALTESQQHEIATLSYYVTPENQGHPHDAGQAIWKDDYAVLRRFDWDDDCGQLSNTRHEYSVYKWEPEDEFEDQYFSDLNIGEFVAEFVIPTK